jgi:peroxiredoxin
MAELLGRPLPNCDLASTAGGTCNFAKLTSRVLLFIYPYTGKPNHPDPPGWDNIPGAHGSTPEALGFSKYYEEFQKLDVKLFGLSFQATEWQSDFVMRNQLRVPLLSDAQGVFARALGLETFQAGAQKFLVRRTIIAVDAAISHDFYPVHDPANHAFEVLQALSK